MNEGTEKTRNNFIKNIILKIKYFKNRFIIKFQLLKRRKNNGEDINIYDYIEALNIPIKKDLNISLKKNKPKNISKKNNIIEDNQDNHNTENDFTTKLEPLKEFIIKHKVISKLTTTIGALLISTGISMFAFGIFNNIKFDNINTQIENTLKNALNSPLTSSKLISYYDNKTKSNVYYFEIIDSLDAYSYRVKNSDINDDMRIDVLKTTTKNIKEIDSLNKINTKELNTIVLYNNNYIINNKYSIKKELVSSSDLSNISKNITINNYKSYKLKRNIFLTLSITPLFLINIIGLNIFNKKNS